MLVGDRIARFVAKVVEAEEAYAQAREILREEEMIRQEEEERRFDGEVFNLWLPRLVEELVRMREAADNDERMLELEAIERGNKLQHEENMRQLEAIGREKQRKDEGTLSEKERENELAEREKQRIHYVAEREKLRKHKRELEL